MVRLTKKQRQTLEFVAAFQRENGYCPTYDQIANGIGASHRSRVHYLVAELEERGFIRRLSGRRQSIEILETPGEARVKPRRSDVVIPPIGKPPESIMSVYCAGFRMP